MKHTILTSIIILAVSPICLCQEVSFTATALINEQFGPAAFREKKGMKEISLIKNKELGRKLYPDQEIRCKKDCKLELLLCTGNKVVLTDKNGWYRIPFMACEKDKIVPGFKKSFQQQGGRSASNRTGDELESQGDVSNRNSSRRRAAARSAVGSILGAIIADGKGASIGAVIGSGTWSAPTPDPNYYEKWFFEFPYEGAVVAPELFIFDIVEGSGTRAVKSGRISLAISISAFDHEHPATTSRVLKEDLYFDKGILLRRDGERFDPAEVRSFLKELRNSYGLDQPRIYCMITVSGIEGTATGDLKPHTFGFEFHVMNLAEEQSVLKDLENASNETGIARYFGRADVFESLGLTSLARQELERALTIWPDNDATRARLRTLRYRERY